MTHIDLAITLLIGVGLIAALLFGVPRLQQKAPAIPTSARIACNPPSEFETQLVYLNARSDGSIEVQCGPMVGGRGAYPGRR